eukprot:361274-Chlamydomonas_euryale.AAC.7
MASHPTTGLAHAAVATSLLNHWTSACLCGNEPSEPLDWRMPLWQRAFRTTGLAHAAVATSLTNHPVEAERRAAGYGPYPYVRTAERASERVAAIECRDSG